MTIFITSDYHLNHDKDFVYEPRGFSSIEEMNETIIRNHNAIVGPEDTVYILGDICLGDWRDVENTASRLNGKIHFIRGNHDSNAKLKIYHDLGWIDEGYATMLTYKHLSFYLSHYPTATSNYDYGKPLERRVLNLSGHTHLKELFDATTDSYNVAVDAHNNEPVSLDRIISDYRKREEKN